MQTYEETLESGKVSKIAIELLEPSPYNEFKADEYEDLKGSILSCGLITPLTVIGPSDEGKYQIVSGERRYRALSDINKEKPGSFDTVPVYIIGDIHTDPLLQKLIIESSNLETRDYSQADINDHRMTVIQILEEMKESGEAKFDNITEELGKYLKASRRYCNMYLKIFHEGTPELQNAFRGKDDEIKNPVKTVHAAEIAGFDKETQNKVVDTMRKEQVSANKAIKEVKKETKKKQPKPFDPGLTKAEMRTMDADYSDSADESGYEEDSYESQKPEVQDDPVPTTSSATPVDVSNWQIDDEDDDNSEDVKAWILDVIHKCEEHESLNEKEQIILDLCRRWISIVDGD